MRSRYTIIITMTYCVIVIIIIIIIFNNIMIMCGPAAFDASAVVAFAPDFLRVAAPRAVIRIN